MHIMRFVCIRMYCTRTRKYITRVGRWARHASLRVSPRLSRVSRTCLSSSPPVGSRSSPFYIRMAFALPVYLTKTSSARCISPQGQKLLYMIGRENQGRMGRGQGAGGIVSGRPRKTNFWSFPLVGRGSIYSRLKLYKRLRRSYRWVKQLVGVATFVRELLTSSIYLVWVP